ncbi:beta-lactamase hydrolase [Acrasis kona]|uniref:Beta-lactamase hydrolase n=1 Tax=Acrasis kona TaxID=1008807 RepID=A0AAW2Z9J4_9EUKA
MSDKVTQAGTKLYAAGQLTESELASVIEKHGIKVVVNLRGDDEAGFIDESDLCKKHGVKYIHHGTSKNPAEWDAALAEKIVKDTRQTQETPVLFHCAAGARAKTFATLFEADSFPDENTDSLIQKANINNPQMIEFAQKILE